jgi:hypothetical protein
MKLTDSMRKCLLLLDRYGEALRIWSGSSGYQWSWRINGTPIPYPGSGAFVRGSSTSRVKIASFCPHSGSAFWGKPSLRDRVPG